MPPYMCLMANSLINAANFPDKFSQKSYDFLREKYINKAFFIDIEGVEIMVSLDEK